MNRMPRPLIVSLNYQKIILCSKYIRTGVLLN
jgi:hypothetical protein